MGWIILLVAILFVAVNFAIFAFKSDKESRDQHDGVRVDAGGTIFVMGTRTYYQQPKGKRQLVADYPMDLRPGSPDMNTFLAIMEKAKKQAAIDASNKRKAALTNMRELAKREAQA